MDIRQRRCTIGGLHFPAPAAIYRRLHVLMNRASDDISMFLSMFRTAAYMDRSDPRHELMRLIPSSVTISLVHGVLRDVGCAASTNRPLLFLPSALLGPTAEVTLLCDGMRDILPGGFLLSQAGVGEVQVRNQFAGFPYRHSSVLVAIRIKKTYRVYFTNALCCYQ